MKFGKNPVNSSEEKFFEGGVCGCTHARTDGRTNRRTNGRMLDGHNTMTIARWPLASGANKLELSIKVMNVPAPPCLKIGPKYISMKFCCNWALSY